MTESPFDNIEFPRFSELPFRKGDPDKAIWGFYEHISGATTTDELGALNLLTQRRILKASRTEIQIGKVCSLNWAMHKPTPSKFGRKGMEHQVKRWPGRPCIIDDEVSFNTQCSSQWDGFRHFGHKSSRLFYNRLPESEIVDSEGNGVPLSPENPQRNGIHTFQGKIVGRGVLLDYYSYAQENGIHYSAVSNHLITAEALEACAKAQNLTFEIGDILFVRMGYTDWYEKASEEEKVKGLKAFPPNLAGIRQDFEEVEWFWNHHFAAVASDTPSFEARPTIQNWDLHEYLLSLWGTPIGEFFDLEDLAQTCKGLNRYSFFLTSSPLHVVNGIASPPNALAIF